MVRSRFDEVTVVRFFRGDRKRRENFLLRYPDRFDSDSEFIRAACQFFMRSIDKNKDLNTQKINNDVNKRQVSK